MIIYLGSEHHIIIEYREFIFIKTLNNYFINARK